MTPGAAQARGAGPGFRAPRLRLPLFAQMFGLIVLSLAAAQAINLLIVYYVPPPPPEFFRITQVAAALRGDGPGLMLPNGRAAAPVSRPEPFVGVVLRPSSVSDYLNRELAQRLRRPDGDVRLAFLDPDRMPTRSSVRAMRRQFSPAPLERNADHFIVAPFEAAVRRPDGGWTTLRVADTGLLGTWRQRLILWFAVSAVALAPVAYLFARRLARPFAAFAAAAERLGRDPRAPPLRASGSPEIVRAVAAFNDMQERLRRYVEDRTAMIGAIAHDLRTPLTRLRFRVEGVAPELKAKMNRDMDEMEQMIAAVMAFVRDASHAGERRPLQLDALVAAVAGEMADTGLDVRMATADATGHPLVEGDPLALRRMVSNLLDNAVKFGACARARVYAEEGSAVLEIDDDGPGVPEAQREQVFEPFYRTERSRSRATGGAGLGLAVVRTIARAHGGDAMLENRPDGGLRATARLPLARSLVREPA